MRDTYYPFLREALDNRFSTLTDAELDSVFESAFGEGVTPAEYEEFFSGLGQAFNSVARDVGRFAQQAAPVAASAAQGALQGGAAGARYGPYGALIGALAGGTGSALQQHGTGAARDVGNVISGVVGTAGALSGGGGAQGLAGLLGGAGGTGGGAGAASAAGGGMGQAAATNQLLRLLGRPETAQALAALLGGRNPAVPAGPSGTPVPANAFAGLLSALARESEAEALGWGEVVAVPAYLVGPGGELLADPGDPDQRSGRLLQLLAGPAREQDEAYRDALGEAGAFDDVYDEYDEYDELVGWPS